MTPPSNPAVVRIHPDLNPDGFQPGQKEPKVGTERGSAQFLGILIIPKETGVFHREEGAADKLLPFPPVPLQP